jgi:hypothetical protein
VKEAVLLRQARLDRERDRNAASSDVGKLAPIVAIAP